MDFEQLQLIIQVLHASHSNRDNAVQQQVTQVCTHVQ